MEVTATAEEVFVSLAPSLLPSAAARTADASSSSSSPLAVDAHALLHLSSYYPWRNAVRRREGAAELLAFIRRKRDAYPVSCYVAAVVMLQRIWRGVISRRRLLRALRARQQMTKRVAEAAAAHHQHVLQMEAMEEAARARASAAEALGGGGSDETVDGAGEEDAGDNDEVAGGRRAGLPSAPTPPPPMEMGPSAPSYASASSSPEVPAAIKRQLRRALPWPAFSERAQQYDKCVKIYSVMAMDEQQRANNKNNTSLHMRQHGTVPDSADAAEEEETLLRAMEIEGAAKTLQQRVRALLMHREVQVWWLRERWPIFFVSAVTIQRAWMARCMRKRGISSLPTSPLAGSANNSSTVTSPYLVNLEAQQWRRKMHRRFFLTKADTAAAKIQDWWRRYLQRKIFRYFVRVIRDSAAIVGANKAATSNYGRSRPLKPFLGSQKNGLATGDGTDLSSSSTAMGATTNSTASQRTAHALLKQIDFGEACMLQSQGSGLHVRFRLANGGVVPFPPVIVYKVGTHANVVDLGLFAPKDYVLEGKKAAERRNQPIVIHNKPETISKQKQRLLTNTLQQPSSGGGGGASPFSPSISAKRGTIGKPSLFGASAAASVGGQTGVVFGVNGAATSDFTGTRPTNTNAAPSSPSASASPRTILNRDGSKGPNPNPLSWVSNKGPTPSPAERAATMGRSTAAVDGGNGAPQQRYERRDNNPWRLADTNAIADGTSLEGLLQGYRRAAQRSLEASRASRMAAEDAKRRGKLLLLSPALAERYGDAITAKQLVSANRSQAATGSMKRAAVEQTVLATQRRWLAELYASEKAFEALNMLRGGGGGAAAKAPSHSSAPSSSFSYAHHKVKAELLFRNVSHDELASEVAKVREWHEALDYSRYRDEWLALGSSV